MQNTSISISRTKCDGKVGITLKQVGDGPIFISKISPQSPFAFSELTVGQVLLAINDVPIVPETKTSNAVALLKEVPTGDCVTIQATKNTVSEGDSDELYEDACQLGQFVLNPCWFLYQGVTRLLRTKKEKNGSEATAARTRLQKAMWMSTVQQTLYLSLFWGSWIVSFTYLYPIGRSKEHFPAWVERLGQGIFALCVLSWIVAKSAGPGSITQTNMHKYDNYKYDGVLYLSNNICPTLGIRKLARSKFDRVSKTHVPRFDHCCGWLGNTIGEENYRFFLLFVFMHLVMFSYCIPVLFQWMWFESLLESDLEDAVLVRAFEAFAVDKLATTVFVVCSGTIVPLFLLFYFHMMIVRKGMTTNEYYKWERLCSTNSNSRAKSFDGTERLDNFFSGSARQQSLRKDSAALQFYDLGLMGNLSEVLFPRSLYTGVKES